jgi:hypothetical protein
MDLYSYDIDEHIYHRAGFAGKNMYSVVFWCLRCSTTKYRIALVEVEDCKALALEGGR